MRIVRRRLGAALVGLGVCLAGGLPSAQPARAATIRQVPADYATIQQAIDAAAPGDTVRVGAGEYDERLSVTKSVVIESVAGAATTVVVGDGSGPTVSIDVEAAETAVLRGFTIMGGHATHGGGVRVSGAGGAFLTRNVVTANSTTSDGFGGGIYTNATGSVRIEANNVFGNTAGNGGGLVVVDPLDTLIVNNLITGNTAGGSGGGVQWWTSGPENDPAFVSNTIAGNDSDFGAAVQGSGVQAGVTMHDNVLAANIAAPLVACYGTGGPPALYTHNVLWNGQWGIWQGLCENAANSGNVEVDPRFADPDHGDYHLRADSPLIDAATADPDVTTDVDGDARPFDGDESGSAANDIGADEATDAMLIAPGGVDFGEVPMVGTQHASIVVGNLGTTPMSIAAASLGGDDPADFSVDPADCVGATLAVGDTCTIEVAVTPTAAGYRAAIIELSGPDPVGTRRIILDAQVMDPLRITGGYQGSTPIGLTVTMPFNVYNSGTDPVSIDELGIVGPAAGDYGIDAETCTAGPLLGGSSCTVTVRVRPTLLGLRAATLTLTGPFPVETREIALQVSGSPSPIDLSWGTPRPRQGRPTPGRMGTHSRGRSSRARSGCTRRTRRTASAGPG